MNTGEDFNFSLNPQKAIEAVLYLLNKRDSVNLYNLIKSIFEADKYHLNSYGRPVTGDKYIREEFGTLPSFIYEIMGKDNDLVADLCNLEEIPFERHSEIKHHFKGTREADSSYLSETDKEALDHGAKEYFDLSFKEVKEKNHQEPCWVEHSHKDVISFRSMIENPEVIEMLEDSKGFTIAV